MGGGSQIKPLLHPGGVGAILVCLKLDRPVVALFDRFKSKIRGVGAAWTRGGVAQGQEGTVGYCRVLRFLRYSMYVRVGPSAGTHLASHGGGVV